MNIYTVPLAAALNNTTSGENLRSVLVQELDCVIPAWSAGIQADMDVSGRMLPPRMARNPCRHDENFHVLWASVSS
jgi:hypothetical protein